MKNWTCDINTPIGGRVILCEADNWKEALVKGFKLLQEMFHFEDDFSEMKNDIMSLPDNQEEAKEFFAGMLKSCGEDEGSMTFNVEEVL